MLKHVLHHTRVKVVKEEWRVKPWWIRCLISSAVSIFHPAPHSCLSVLWFLFSLFLLFAERADCAALSECSKRTGGYVLFPSSSIWWEKLDKTMSGGGVRPLCSLFHLLSRSLSLFLLLCSRFSRWQWCSLQISCRCGTFHLLWHTLNTHPCPHANIHAKICM